MTRITPSSTLIILFCIACLVAFKEQSSGEKAAVPESDLGHIDIILDSATFNAIKESAFIQTEFGVLYTDTAHYAGKPSYDMYVLGHLNFLHLSLARGFWNNQQGGGVLVFQTRKPGMVDPLLKAWKEFYRDSLFIHTYKGSDFVLDEVMAWHQRDTTKPKEPSVFANLTSYSADAYRNWGITDSIVNAGSSMKMFMDSWGGDRLRERLFHSITELHMTLNPQEFKEIQSSLLATGYQQRELVFTHPFNPPIFVTMSDDNNKSKYSRVKFRLTRPVSPKEIVFSPRVRLELNGNEGWLVLN